MTQQDKEQLKLEIDHIFESGANEIRIFEMVVNFIDSRNGVNKNFVLADISERFSSEGEILQWLYLNTPFAIKPKSKRAKRLLVNSFTSNHAFEEVCKHLANKLHNTR